MTPAEAAALLGIAAAFDNRKPDADAAKAWSVALDGLRFEDCRDVIVAHYRRTADWLMPAHIITEVRRLRSKRLHEAPPVTPPPDLTPIETTAWLAAERRRIADGDQPSAYPAELRPRHLPDLKALMPATEEQQ